jgi:hypothetical protein
MKNLFRTVFSAAVSPIKVIQCLILFEEIIKGKAIPLQALTILTVPGG